MPLGLTLIMPMSLNGCSTRGRVGEDAVMRVRFAGSGDAFGSGGRGETCIHLSGEGQGLLGDCGATSPVGLKAQGLDPNAGGAVAGVCSTLRPLSSISPSSGGEGTQVARSTA